jgi:FkbM family methyltransferase
MRRAVIQLLDRRGCRWLLGLLASAFVSVGRRERCRARWRDGVWRHEFPGGVIFDTKVTTMTPALLDARARDIFAWGYVPRDGDVVVDVGAGTGTELRTFSRLVGPAGRVIAVEAHPGTFRCLRLTAEAYGLENVTLVNAAIADRPGELGITDLFAGRGNSVITGGRPRHVVPALTLDDLLDRHDVRDVALLKMNIEGAEKLAIKGMRRAVTRIRNVAISCHDFKARRTGDASFVSRDVVATFLRDHGYALGSRPNDPRASVADYLYGARDAMSSYAAASAEALRVS